MIALAVAAFSIGIGCGTCCSPFVSAFLSTYAVSGVKLSDKENTNRSSMKESMNTFFGFFIGKLLGVSVLCMAASEIGKQFIDESGFIGGFPFRLVLQIVMSLFGAFMAVRWFWAAKGKHSECRQCKDCKGQKGSMQYPVLIAGVLYGIMPCPPLLLVLGYAAGMPLVTAGVTGICFGFASILSPLLMMMVILGVLSNRMRKEIPGFLKWFRLASYILLMVLPFTLDRAAG